MKLLYNAFASLFSSKLFAPRRSPHRSCSPTTSSLNIPVLSTKNSHVAEARHHRPRGDSSATVARRSKDLQGQQFIWRPREEHRRPRCSSGKRSCSRRRGDRRRGCSEPGYLSEASALHPPGTCPVDSWLVDQRYRSQRHPSQMVRSVTAVCHSTS